MNEPEVRHRSRRSWLPMRRLSRVMAEDDRVAPLRGPARAVFRTHIQAQGGRNIDTAGDSVSPPSNATGAVRAAVAIQRSSHHCAGQRNAARLWFRIGVHLGDVLRRPTAASTATESTLLRGFRRCVNRAA